MNESLALERPAEILVKGLLQSDLTPWWGSFRHWEGVGAVHPPEIKSWVQTFRAAVPTACCSCVHACEM